jgi:integrase
MSRRSAGEGSLYFRADKQLWVAQYNGVYRYSKDENKAKEKLDELLSKADASKPENITVSTMIDQWFEYQSPNIKPATAKRYSEVIRLYITPAFGHIKVRNLSAYNVQSQYSKWLASGTSPNTINHIHTVLSGAFKRAAKWRLVSYNIIQDVDASKIKRKEVEVFDPSEVQSLLSASKSSPLEAVFVLALSTGMRGGEILALQPTDYHDGKLNIRRTLVNNSTSIGTPKSNNSRRTLQLPEIAIEAVERHLSEGDGGAWLFQSKAGTVFFYHNFLRFHWKPLVERAGIEYRSFHTCRHYVASSLIGQGIPISAVARYLGDTEVTILRTYSHLINGMESMVPAAMDAALGYGNRPTCLFVAEDIKLRVLSGASFGAN